MATHPEIDEIDALKLVLSRLLLASCSSLLLACPSSGRDPVSRKARADAAESGKVQRERAVLAPDAALVSSTYARTRKPSKDSQPDITLTVSSHHRKILVPIAQASYRGREVYDLFQELAEAGDPFCAMAWRRRKLDLDLAGRLVRKEQAKGFLRKGLAGLNGLTSGCWNFYTMNDLKPDLDMKLLAAMAPDGKEGFDCYAIGLMQPYIMATSLVCRSMTMLDIDWRILEAHAQLISLFFGRKLVNASNDELAGLKLSWTRHLSFEKPPQNVIKVPASLSTICDRPSRLLCKKTIETFQRGMGGLESFRLSLSALHDESFTNEGSKAPKAVFLSNVLDPQYTPTKKIQDLLTHLVEATRPGQKVYLIHHVGGDSRFGIYSFQRTATPERYSIETLCKDPYRRLYRFQWFPYKLALDRMSRNRRPRSCRSFLRKLKIR